MKFEEFTKLLDKELDYKSEIPKNRTYSATKRNNGVVNNSVIIRDEDSLIAPSIHLDYYYSQFLSGRDIGSICDEICEIYNNQPCFDKNKLVIDWDSMREHIFFTLINADRNSEMLERVPNIPLLDLAVIFKIDTSYIGIDGTITIDSRLQDRFNRSLGELYRQAAENTPLICPYRFELMTDALSELIGNIKDVNGESAENDMIPLYVLTNSRGLFGAAAVLYEEFRVRAMEEFGGDMYVIPSSVNEVILIGFSEGIQREELDAMIQEVNETPYVSETEFLSHRAYTYRELTDAFNKATETYI